jgi:glycosyltransferase involved in cell wall biosynthesis
VQDSEDQRRLQALRSVEPGFGINLFGQFSAATGLGVVVRHLARALRALDVPLSLFDLPAYFDGSDVSDEMHDMAPFLVADPRDLRHPINLFCAPVVAFPDVLESLPPEVTQGRFNAATVFWETTKLHSTWIAGLTQLDALVAPSDFLMGVLANSVPVTPVFKGFPSVNIPAGIGGDRKLFGLPDNTTLFVSSFDPSSDAARKNPLATITAFRMAFAANVADVRLVFRLNNAYATSMAQQTTQAMIEAAQGDARIGFALEPLNYQQVLTLFASADGYVSLHRAEGLGLGMLESMHLGVPVVATAWSGNMDFMNNRVACLVRYELEGIAGNHPFYREDLLGPGAVWAKPLIEDAASWMRHLYLNPAERQRIGLAGKAHVTHLQKQAASLEWLHELASLWRNRLNMPQINVKLSSKHRA